MFVISFSRCPCVTNKCLNYGRLTYWGNSVCKILFRNLYSKECISQLLTMKLSLFKLTLWHSQFLSLNFIPNLINKAITIQIPIFALLYLKDQILAFSVINYQPRNIIVRNFIIINNVGWFPKDIIKIYYNKFKSLPKLTIVHLLLEFKR